MQEWEKSVACAKNNKVRQKAAKLVEDVKSKDVSNLCKK
jgi:hypothetical protein